MANDSSIREHIDQAESGAPAGGRAIRDMFSTDEIFHRITATADEEFSRSTRLLFLSGLAAGFSIGLSFLGSAALSAKVPSEAAWLVGAMLYPLGFIFIVIGRYQLFTENTLTPVTLVLTRIASLPLLLRVWGCVLLANILGAGAISYILATTGVLEPASAEVAVQMGKHALAPDWMALFWKGGFAGWIVAGMVWLNHAARDTTSRVLITFILIYTVAVTDLAHSIIGSSEVLYLVFRRQATFGTFLFSYFIPVVLGNTVGGVLLVAILNYSQTRQVRFPDRDCGKLELRWSEWLFGRHSGLPDLLSSGDRMENGNEDEELMPPVGSEDHCKGSSDAPVTLVQYGDYECPTSFRIQGILEEVLRELDQEVSIVYRHLPLSRRHPHAEHAAIAAEAAARQDKFWEMHERLFDHQDNLDDDHLKTYAEEIGLDRQQFVQDLESDECRDRVLHDRRSGVRSGVQGTSNLFVNGRRYRGEMEIEEILRAVNRVSNGLALK